MFDGFVDAFEQPRLALGAAVGLHQHFDQLAQRRVGELAERVERIAVALDVIVGDALRSLVLRARRTSPAAHDVDRARRQRPILAPQHFELLRIGKERHAERRCAASAFTVAAAVLTAGFPQMFAPKN
jgi:hypothetical protein